MKDYWQVIPEIVGYNAQLRLAVMQAVMAVERGQHFLVEGEAGSGRRLLARSAWCRRAPGARSLFTLDCRMFSAEGAEMLLFGEHPMAGAQVAGKLNLAIGGGLLLLHAETLPAKTQKRLAETVRQTMQERGEGFQLVLTTTTLGVEDLEPGLAALVQTIHLPPLRERVEDIRALSEAYLHGAAPFDRVVCSAALIEKFCGYEWPGNVAELRAVLRRLLLGRHNGVLDIAQLAEQMQRDASCNAILQGGQRPAKLVPGLLFDKAARDKRSWQ